jgi:hypothetical protein
MDYHKWFLTSLEGTKISSVKICTMELQLVPKHNYMWNFRFIFHPVPRPPWWKLKLNSVAFSPQANYTDRATVACLRSWCQLLRIEDVEWSAQRIPTTLNPGFLHPEPLLFHSSSSSVILTRVSGPGNRTRAFWICSQELWPRYKKTVNRITECNTLCNNYFLIAWKSEFPRCHEFSVWEDPSTI